MFERMREARVLHFDFFGDNYFHVGGVMRIHRPLLTIMFFLFSAGGLAQDAHIRTKYLENRKTTVVSIDPMFVMYTPDRRVAVDIRFDYPKQRLVKPPKQINFSLRSLAKELKYPQGGRTEIAILADGEPLKLGKVVYLATGWALEKDRLVGVTSKPQVKGGGVSDENGKPITGPVEEMFAAAIGPEAFPKLADAKTVEIRVGDETFGFTENQMNSVRAFAKLTTP